MATVVVLVATDDSILCTRIFLQINISFSLHANLVLQATIRPVATASAAFRVDSKVSKCYEVLHLR